jgi:4-carboxymuconolactone decarboxylase
MTSARDLSQKAADLRAVIDQHLPPASARIPIAGLYPDADRIATELMWGGIWNEPGLDHRLRSIATITAQAVNGFDFGLHHQCRVGLTLGIPPQTLKAMLLELRFWIGVPNTVFAFLKLQEVINERKEWQALDAPVQAPWLPTVEEKVARGREAMRKEWGERAEAEMAQTATHDMVPGAAAIVDGYHYGEVWARSPLTAKERMVSILAALMCRGHWKQLRRQIGYALDAGLTKREICETFAQAGWYRGWPYVEDALEEAKTVFAARGV